MLKIIHVVAMTNTGVIGVGSKLPFVLKEDLQKFKQLTENKLVVLGYNTFKSIHENYCKDPNVFLKGRKVVVVIDHPKQKDESENDENTKSVEQRKTLKEIKAKYTNLENVNFISPYNLNKAINSTLLPVIVIGGAKLFKELPNPYCIFATVVEEDSLPEKNINEEEAIYYPYFNSLKTDFLEFKEKKQKSSNGISYQFITYLS